MRHQERRLALKFVFCGIFSFLLPLSLGLLWFAYRGALPELLEVYVIYPMTVYSSPTDAVPLSSRVRGVLEFALGGWVTLAGLPAVVVGTVALGRLDRVGSRIAVVWLVLTVVIVAVQGRFFLYHWLPLMPPFTLLAVIGFHSILKPRTIPDQAVADFVRPARLLAATAFLIMLVAASVRPALESVRWVTFAAGVTDRMQYLDGFGIPGQEARAARYIEQRTSSDDLVAIWGWNTSVLYLTDRRSPTRFVFSMPLLMNADSPLVERYRREFLTSLSASPPVYFLVGPGAPLILGYQFEWAQFPELERYLENRYEQVETFGTLALWRLRAEVDSRT